jgi:zinc transporter 9
VLLLSFAMFISTFGLGYLP